MLFRRIWPDIYLAEDTGIDVGSLLGAGDDGGDGDGDGKGTDPILPGDAPKKAVAKYASQLPKAWQDDDFTGIEELPSLYEGYRKLQKEVEASKDKVSIPTKDSKPDEVRGFLRRLGMPEKAEDYDLPDYDVKPEAIAASKANFMKTALGAGLTKAQAKAMWKDRLADMKSMEAVVQSQLKATREGFRPGLEAELKADYPDDAKRRQRADREEALYKEFVADTGLGEVFTKGLIDISPEAVHKIALYAEKVRGKGSLDGFGRDDDGKDSSISGTDALVNIYKQGQNKG